MGLTARHSEYARLHAKPGDKHQPQSPANASPRRDHRCRQPARSTRRSSASTALGLTGLEARGDVTGAGCPPGSDKLARSALAPAEFLRTRPGDLQGLLLAEVLPSVLRLARPTMAKSSI
jgi:hypothetical protein